MKKGNGVIAAFMGHRFAGYGFLESEFYQDKGKGFQIRVGARGSDLGVSGTA